MEPAGIEPASRSHPLQIYDLSIDTAIFLTGITGSRMFPSCDTAILSSPFATSQSFIKSNTGHSSMPDHISSGMSTSNVTVNAESYLRFSIFTLLQLSAPGNLVADLRASISLAASSSKSAIRSGFPSCTLFLVGIWRRISALFLNR